MREHTTAAAAARHSPANQFAAVSSSSSSVSPALFGSPASVFGMTGTNASTVLQPGSGGASPDVEKHSTASQVGAARAVAGMDMDVEMRMRQSEREDSPYPFAFAVPDLRPTTAATAAAGSTGTNNCAPMSNDRDDDASNAVVSPAYSAGYHAFLTPITNIMNAPHIPTSDFAPAFASFYSPGNASFVTPGAYMGMTPLPPRTVNEQYLQYPQQQQQRGSQQEEAWSSTNATRPFHHSQSMEHLFPSTPAQPLTTTLPSVPSVPSMSSYTRVGIQNDLPGHSRRLATQAGGGLFVPSHPSMMNAQGYDHARGYDGQTTSTAAANDIGAQQRMYQYDLPTSIGYQRSQQYQPDRPQQQMNVPAGLSYPLHQQQQFFATHQPTRQNDGPKQDISDPTFSPFVRPVTNDSNPSVGGYIVNEAQGHGGRYATGTGTGMNGAYHMPFPPSTATSTVFDGGAFGGRYYVPMDPQQHALVGYAYQPTPQHLSYAHHQRQPSTDSLLLEELSTANTTPVFTPSTFPAFLPSTSVAYAPSPHPSRHPGQGGTHNGEDVEMRESLGPTPSISTERGREETIGAGGYRSSSPKRGRRRGETKPGPNFLTKLYAVLSDPAYHHMLHWADDGVQIIIRKPKELEARVLPLVYKQSKFASFSRQLNIYGFMRKVSMRHVDMNRDSDVSVWTHYELNRYSSADKLMSYKRRVGPRHYTRKNGLQAPASSTKNLFPNGVPAGVRYEEIAPPSVHLSPGLAFANAATPGMSSCHVHAFGSPYSVSTNTLSDQSLPDTPASVSPVRPIRTHGKSHKMSAGTLPMPSFHNRSNFVYPSGGRSVPHSSITSSQHSMYAPLNGSATKPTGDSSSGILQGGLWQSLLGNAGMPQTQMTNNAQFSSCLFPAIGLPDYRLARASFQPLVGPTYAQTGETHAQPMDVPMMNQIQRVPQFAPLMQQQQQMVYPSGSHAPIDSITHPMQQPSRTLSNSSASSSMLMTPPRHQAIHVKTEQVDQSPVFSSFALSLEHASADHQHAMTGSATDQMGKQAHDADNEKHLTIAGNQAFASFLHDMGSSPAPSAVEMHTEARPTPAVAVHASTPRLDQDTATHEMFVNSFDTVRPQALKPASSSEMQVVVADIGETEDDMRYLEETFHSRQVRRSDAANGAVLQKEERSLDEQGCDERVHRSGSFMDKTVRQGQDDPATDEFDAWMVVQHSIDG
ncbi:hypothetical protein QFC21_006049 [Naganishia friedmannii]|uniref:Uncharacterized protein n=1 Tax=Naganishia friedmannii TaxID=89922 RepID=A0ACC2V4C7_9TREE|nr:hypothetical protein QFC21_006049 [Naganishia friedmannii]